jgi:hypothetical protein
VQARSFGFATIRVDGGLDPSWHGIELAPGFNWTDWLKSTANRPEARDLKRAFLSLATATAAPLLTAQDQTEAVPEFTECRLPGGSTELVALTAAHCLDAPLASHATRAPWDATPLKVEVNTLEDAGELATHAVELINLFSSGALASHRVTLIEKRDAVFNTATDLWVQRATLFPDTTFCPGVEEQLRNWQNGASLLKAVRNALTELQRFAADWRAGIHREYSHDALRRYLPRLSDESESVANDPRRSEKRYFRLPCGQKRYFSFHIKLQHIRVHYLPVGAERQIYIGYIGNHLP